MTWCYLAIAFSVGLTAGRVRLRRGPVNIVDGILLPLPADERWKRVKIDMTWSHSICRYQLGSVSVSCSDRATVWINGDELKSRRYANAVIKSQMERHAIESAL